MPALAISSENSQKFSIVTIAILWVGVVVGGVVVVERFLSAQRYQFIL
jgi:hypothetical protein